MGFRDVVGLNKKPETQSPSNERPQWEIDDEADQAGAMIELPERPQEPAKETASVNAAVVAKQIADLLTRQGVTMYHSRENPDVIEFRWYMKRTRTAHIYRVGIAGVKYVKIPM